MAKPWDWITAKPIPATKAVRNIAANAAPAVNALKPCALQELTIQLNMNVKGKSFH